MTRFLTVVCSALVGLTLAIPTGVAQPPQRIFTAVTGVWVETSPTAEVLSIDPGDGYNELGNVIGNFRLNNAVAGRYVFRGDANGGTLTLEFSANGTVNRFSFSARLPVTNRLSIEGYGKKLQYKRAGTP